MACVSERPADPSGGSARAATVVVVGGGIAGLTVAHRLATLGVSVRLLEGSPRLGGKLAHAELAGVPVDTGAEALLNRRPEAVALAREVGLGDDIRHPDSTAAGVWSRGALRPLPPTVLGVPSDLAALSRSGVISPVAVVRAGLERLLPGRFGALPTPRDESADDPLEDVSVGRFVAGRLGPGVRDRLLEPLLGGIYAGSADELSLVAAAPQVAALARHGGSLLVAAERSRLEAGAKPAVPVFAGVVGGVSRLAESVAAAAVAAGAVLHTGVSVRALAARDPASPGARWQLAVGRADLGELVDADAVVIATPAASATRLLAGVVPAAARELRRIDYASVALVTLAVPASGVWVPPERSGYLVPPVEGRAATAVTWSSNKWAWVRDRASHDHGGGTVVVRVSFGRHRQANVLQRDDTDLVDLAVAELSDASGLSGPLIDARVDRWGGALPQYAVGHAARVARIRTAVEQTAGLEVCGAAYDGVGVAACVADGRRAAERIARWLAARPGGVDPQRGTMRA